MGKASKKQKRAPQVKINRNIKLQKILILLCMSWYILVRLATSWYLLVCLGTVNEERDAAASYEAYFYVFAAA